MGYTMDMRMAITARTTINSISVKPREKQGFLVIDLIGEERMILMVSRERKRKRTAHKEDA
jgi:hypothetical protein